MWYTCMLSFYSTCTMYHVNRALYLFSIFKACCIHVHVALEIDGGILILSGNVVNGFFN